MFMIKSRGGAENSKLRNYPEHPENSRKLQSIIPRHGLLYYVSIGVHDLGHSIEFMLKYLVM